MMPYLVSVLVSNQKKSTIGHRASVRFALDEDGAVGNFVRDLLGEDPDCSIDNVSVSVLSDYTIEKIAEICGLNKTDEEQ